MDIGNSNQPHVVLECNSAWYMVQERPTMPKKRGKMSKAFQKPIGQISSFSNVNHSATKQTDVVLFFLYQQKKEGVRQLVQGKLFLSQTSSHIWKRVLQYDARYLVESNQYDFIKHLPLATEAKNRFWWQFGVPIGRIINKSPSYCPSFFLDNQTNNLSMYLVICTKIYLLHSQEHQALHNIFLFCSNGCGQPRHACECPRLY